MLRSEGDDRRSHQGITHRRHCPARLAAALRLSRRTQARNAQGLRFLRPTLPSSCLAGPTQSSSSPAFCLLDGASGNRRAQGGGRKGGGRASGAAGARRITVSAARKKKRPMDKTPLPPSPSPQALIGSPPFALAEALEPTPSPHAPRVAVLFPATRTAEYSIKKGQRAKRAVFGIFLYPLRL